MHDCEISAKLMKTPLITNYLPYKIHVDTKKEADLSNQPLY